MSEDNITQLDEITRRYYLEAMGIQCWELVDKVAETGDASSDDIDARFRQSEMQSSGWQSLDRRIQQCVKCQLHVSRKQAISGRGKQSAELMFVLLAPTAVDDESGMLCSGDANALFKKMLAAINVSIDNVYITSLLKCSVPAQHTISSSEIRHCSAYLKQQVQLVQPRLIIVLGDTATRCLLQRDLTLDALRSLVNENVVLNGDSNMVLSEAKKPYQFESIPLFVSYSPQELLRKPVDKRKAWSDLQAIQKMIVT